MYEPGVPTKFTATGDLAGTPTARIVGMVLTAAAAAATAVIREGGSGGTVVLDIACPVNETRVIPICMAIRQPHLTLSGAGASFTAFM